LGRRILSEFDPNMTVREEVTKMKVTIVLNGGLKSCCSTYPPEYVHKVVEGWLRGIGEVEVVDKQKEGWIPDSLASMATKYFGDDAYPLLYVGETLAAVSRLPEMDTLIGMATNKVKFGVTERDITEAAKRNGLIKDEAGKGKQRG